LNTATESADRAGPDVEFVESAEQRRQRSVDEIIGKFERLATVTQAKADELKDRAKELNRVAFHFRQGAERLKRRYARQVFDKEQVQ